MQSVHDLIAFDRAHVWHPYASMPAAMESLVVDSAQGVRLRLAKPFEGNDELIDGMSSWWSVIHGYKHPVLDAALRAQLEKMSHVMFGGLTHEPAIKLAQILLGITPQSLQHVFFCDSGSVSVEVAMKMCLQYWRSIGKPEKQRFFTWRGGYHGDTFHPMSVCDPDGGMHSLWKGVLPTQVFAEEPPLGFGEQVSDAYLAHLESVISTSAHELAAIIVEPVVQGAGGMRFHNPEYVKRLRELATRYEVLLVVDEIATGFGRTGELFAVNHAEVQPDIMCIGKALTGGYMSMAATLCSSDVANRISSGDVPVLAHGPTFMANPLASAVAHASVSLLLSTPWRENIERIESTLSVQLAPASEINGVKDVRVLGGIGVIQLDHEVDIALATKIACANGVWLRPFRDLIYAMPPYISTEDELKAIANAMCLAAEAA